MNLDRYAAGAAGLVVAGALLVVSLLLDWWGVPPVLLDPPPNAPEEIALPAESISASAESWHLEDAFGFYEVRDILWLATGIGCFAMGLVVLLRGSLSRWLLAGAGIAAMASLVLIALSLISPPDYLEETRELIEDAGGEAPPAVAFEAPFGREAGPWVALAAAGGLVAASLAQLFGHARSHPLA